MKTNHTEWSIPSHLEIKSAWYLGATHAVSAILKEQVRLLKWIFSVQEILFLLLPFKNDIHFVFMTFKNFNENT